MKNIFFFIAVVCAFVCFYSCEESDNFSSSPGLRLSFSSDTVRFDTVFTEIGSATKRILIYNKNDNSINVNSVELMGGNENGFRMNVDGISGNKISNVDILKKDSLFVFIEVTVDPLGVDNPLYIRDSIRFDFNGISQYIHLEAIGQDVIMWKDGLVVEKDTIITATKPILVYDSVIVNKDAILNIDKNVRLYFHAGAGLYVNGSVRAMGTMEEPILLRGDRMDNLFTTVPYDRVPGQWEGVYIDSLSFNNHFENVRIRNSKVGIHFNPSNISEKKAVLINSIVHNTTLDGISAVNCDIEAYNSQFTNAGKSTLKLIGGEYYFLHCTVANYMSYRGLTGDYGLIIGNIKDDSGLAPLNKCEFVNSIIASRTSVTKFQNELNNNIANIPFKHLFTNCLFNTNGKDDENFIHTVWGEEPKFKILSPNYSYYYNFELDSESPAINKGDKSYLLNEILSNPYAAGLQYDLRGINRLQDEAPDLGCYEWIEEEKED